MYDSSDNMSVEEGKVLESPKAVRTKPKKRSLVERELETSLTERVTSPIIQNDSLTTSRYGRARRSKTDMDFIDIEKKVSNMLKSPNSEKCPTPIQSPVYKMHASNSPIKDVSKNALTIGEHLESLERIESVYNENLSLSRFGSEENKTIMLPENKTTKIYVRKDLLQNKESEETASLLKNMFSPPKSLCKTNTHLNNVLERSSEKYSLGNKSRNGYLGMSSVVKTLDFDSGKQKRKDVKEKTMVLSKNELFEMEASCEYQVGDLAWARVGTYPFWPCIVTREPTSGMFMKKKMFGRVEHDVVHVTFFGDNGRRGWIVDKMLRKFVGLPEFEATRDQFTIEAKKKDPRLHAAFFVSDKKLALWKLSVHEAELLIREPKRFRIDVFNDMLEKTRLSKSVKRANGKVVRTNSDVSLSESLLDTLFSDGDSRADDSDRFRNKQKNQVLDVSEVVTACLDNMAAKTGIIKIQRQSHMDRWLQKAKSKTPEKLQSRNQVTIPKIEIECKRSTSKKKKQSSPANLFTQSKKPYALRKSVNESHNKLDKYLFSNKNNSSSDPQQQVNESELLDTNKPNISECFGLGIVIKVETLSEKENQSDDQLSVKEEFGTEEIGQSSKQSENDQSIELSDPYKSVVHNDKTSNDVEIKEVQSKCNVEGDEIIVMTQQKGNIYDRYTNNKKDIPESESKDPILDGALIDVNQIVNKTDIQVSESKNTLIVSNVKKSDNTIDLQMSQGDLRSADNISLINVTGNVCSTGISINAECVVEKTLKEKMSHEINFDAPTVFEVKKNIFNSEEHVESNTVNIVPDTKTAHRVIENERNVMNEVINNDQTRLVLVNDIKYNRSMKFNDVLPIKVSEDIPTTRSKSDNSNNKQNIRDIQITKNVEHVVELEESRSHNAQKNYVLQKATLNNEEMIKCNKNKIDAFSSSNCDIEESAHEATHAELDTNDNDREQNYTHSNGDFNKTLNDVPNLKHMSKFPKFKTINRTHHEMSNNLDSESKELIDNEVQNRINDVSKLTSKNINSDQSNDIYVNDLSDHVSYGVNKKNNKYNPNSESVDENNIIINEPKLLGDNDNENRNIVIAPKESNVLNVTTNHVDISELNLKAKESNLVNDISKPFFYTTKNFKVIYSVPKVVLEPLQNIDEYQKIKRDIIDVQNNSVMLMQNGDIKNILSEKIATNKFKNYLDENICSRVPHVQIEPLQNVDNFLKGIINLDVEDGNPVMLTPNRDVNHNSSEGNSVTLLQNGDVIRNSSEYIDEFNLNPKHNTTSSNEEPNNGYTVSAMEKHELFSHTEDSEVKNTDTDVVPDTEENTKKSLNEVQLKKIDEDVQVGDSTKTENDSKPEDVNGDAKDKIADESDTIECFDCIVTGEGNLPKPSMAIKENENKINTASIQTTEIKTEIDLETVSIKSEDSEASLSKRKLRSKNNSRQGTNSPSITLDHPDFVKYLELRQDHLIDEHPELTQEEIVNYLYKTWMYEEGLKPVGKRTDDIDESELVKGLKRETEKPKKMKKKKVKAEPKDEIYGDEDLPSDIDVKSKDKPRRKIAKAYYSYDISDIEDEIEIFEIGKSTSTAVKHEGKHDESLKNTSILVDQSVQQIAEVKQENGVIEEHIENYDAEEVYFDALTVAKPNLFKGLVREKVCQICEKIGNLIKCKGCHEMFHIECIKRQSETTEVLTPSRGSQGRKKKNKPRGRRPKGLDDSNGLDSESQSDEKSQDANHSGDLQNISIDDMVKQESVIVADAENFEAKLETKMKELLEKPLDLDYETSDCELDWNDIAVGKCEIVDVKLKLKKTDSPVIDYPDFKCNDCLKYDVPICFVCKSSVSPKTGMEYRHNCHLSHCHKYYHYECLDHWPQTQFKSGDHKKQFEPFTCPRHVCHTCVSDDPRGCKTRFSADKLARCVRCPATYHCFTKCLPAGSQILTGSHIICPRHYRHRPGKVPCHVNTGWCFICALGGSLICCEYCPTSFHAECLNIKPPEGNYMCEDCETGRLPLYGEMVWVKLGHYRWWPGIILHPSEIPANILAFKHQPGEFVVRFFGQYDHYWVNRGRVFPFQEGDSGRVSSQKSKIDEAFTKAIEHAQRACEILKTAKANEKESHELVSSLLPPQYVKLKSNKPIGSLVAWRPDEEEHSLTQCECDPREEEPCGPYSTCLNRMLLTECGPPCRAGDRCLNRAFEKRQYPKLVPYRTPHRGWGLKTLEDIKQGQFVIEYVGELIDQAEFQTRMRWKHEMRDENYYFLTLDKDRMIDAGPKGNLARFMNHCCEPNCETQKWTVLSDVRVGLFAMYDIPAGSEVTFNYNLESAGIEKKRCLCGAKRCSGYIGAKPKQDESQSKKAKPNPVQTKRGNVLKKKKNNVVPEIGKIKPKRLGRPPKPKELTEIEKDLLIIKNATNGMSSDSESSCRLSLDTKDQKPLKRKRVSFSTEEIVYDGKTPSVKRAKLDVAVD